MKQHHKSHRWQHQSHLFFLEICQSPVPTSFSVAILFDCLPFVQVERALKVAEELIRAAPVELDNAAEELARALIHVRVSSIAVEDEEDALEKRRHGALVALLVCAPLSSVVIITTEIFSAHVDISQRLLLLDAMSGILSSSLKPNHSFSSEQSYLIKP
jgi:hypothetical protein